MGNADFIRHSYTVSKSLKSYEIYELSNVQFGTPQLTKVLRIEPYRNYSEATGIKDYLRLRTCGNWERSEKVTGLRPTKRPGVFYGDRVKEGSKKSLLIFTISDDRRSLTIDYFRSFYPFTAGQLQNIIAAHPLSIDQKKERGVQPSLDLFKCNNTGNALQAKNSEL